MAHLENVNFNYIGTSKKDKFNLIACSNIIVALYVVEFQPNNKEEEGQYWPRLIALESGERTSLT